MSGLVIETENLTKNYGKSRGITDVNLTVSEGEIFGFMGQNGAGKSTTIRTLLGLLKPTGGTARIFGKSISHDRNTLLADIGYMPGEAIFYRNMTVADVISLSAKLRKTDCRAESAALCDRLDLDTHRRIGQLSLGTRKKVSIVCAMQHKPKLYILDEPTGGLDPIMQKEFFDLLKERNKQGATIFLSSHIINEIQRHCSRAAIIKEGRIIVCDEVMRLTNNNTKRVTLYGINKLPKFTGVYDGKTLRNSVTFLFNGEIKELMSKVIFLPITDMTITEPELDEIFIHYYK